MHNATRTFHNRIAIVFDFDETLAPSTYPYLLQHLNLDPDQFQRERVQPLLDAGWEEVLAKGYALIDESHRREAPITMETFRAVGEQLNLYEGVPSLLDRLREKAHAILPSLEIEFYLLTAGFAEIPQSTPIAHQFTKIWGGAFHMDEAGAINFVKRVVTHPEKVRYLLMLSKGLEENGPNGPADVYRDVADNELYIPMEQMIYVGDGSSDMPAFSLMHDRGGIALGVVNADKIENWDGYEDIRADQRLQNLAPADYSDESELMLSLELALESVCKRIALRKLSIGQ